MKHHPQWQVSWLHRGLILAAAMLVAACTSVPRSDTTAAPDFWAVYAQALADSAVSSPDKTRPLLPIPNQPTVQVVSWVIGDRKPCDTPGCSFTVRENRMWVTLAGEVQNKCQQWGLQGDALRERLEQLLGLPPHTPPQWRKTHMLTLQVPRDALERPCLGETVDSNGAPRCTPRSAKTTSPELLHFVLNQMADVWVDGDPNGPGYPFTRLGYTYDWHPDAAAKTGNYGASEFVLKPGTGVTVVSEATTDSFCQR